MQSIRRIMVTGGCTLTRDSQRLIGHDLYPARCSTTKIPAARNRSAAVNRPAFKLQLQQLRVEIDSLRHDGPTFTKQLYTCIYIYIYIYIARTATRSL